MAKALNRPEQTVQEELRRIERRLGFYIMDYQREYEEQADKDSLERMRSLVHESIIMMNRLFYSRRFEKLGTSVMARLKKIERKVL